MTVSIPRFKKGSENIHFPLISYLLVFLFICYYVYMSIWRAIFAKTPSYSTFISELEKNATEPLKTSQEDLEQFVSTWEKKPKIKLKAKKKRGNIEVLAGVESKWTKGQKAKPEDILMFLTRGTDVRYATMSSDFIAKTSYRNLASGTGRGGKLYVSLSQPRSGIKAREIEELIKKNRSKQIIKDYNKILKAAASKSGLRKVSGARVNIL